MPNHNPAFAAASLPLIPADDWPASVAALEAAAAAAPQRQVIQNRLTVTWGSNILTSYPVNIPIEVEARASHWQPVVIAFPAQALIWSVAESDAWQWAVDQH